MALLARACQARRISRSIHNMAKSLQETLRLQLLRGAAAGTAAFETSGVLQLAKPLKLYFQDNNGDPGCVTFPLRGNEPTELQPLLDACAIAPFGLGRKTVVDEGVRKALQMPAARLGLGLATSLPGDDILEDIQQLMMPEADGLIRAEVYSLNVYSPDGFFKAHRDTPHSSAMFGSLVFCLPTEFSGGELVIKGPDLNERSIVTHDWGATSSDRCGAGGGMVLRSGRGSSGGAGALAWAAIYSDCEHEVKPVTTGHRVTLTYNLYQPAPARSRSNQDSGSSAAANSARESAFGVQLSAALNDATWKPEGATLGLVLEHMYAVEPLDKCVAAADLDRPYNYESYYRGEPNNRPASIEPSMLKGSDLQLCLAAQACGLEVRILPVVSLTDRGAGRGALSKNLDDWGAEDEFEDDWEEEEGQEGQQETEEEEQEKSDCECSEGDSPEAPRSPRPREKLAVVNSWEADPTGGDEWSCEYATWRQFLQGHITHQCAAHITGDLLWVKPPGKQHLIYCGPAKEYTGNEGTASTCFYAAAALLVTVPAVGEPGRQGTS